MFVYKFLLDRDGGFSLKIHIETKNSCGNVEVLLPALEWRLLTDYHLGKRWVLNKKQEARVTAAEPKESIAIIKTHFDELMSGQLSGKDLRLDIWLGVQRPASFGSLELTEPQIQEMENNLRDYFYQVIMAILKLGKSYYGVAFHRSAVENPLEIAIGALIERIAQQEIAVEDLSLHGFSIDPTPNALPKHLNRFDVSTASIWSGDAKTTAHAKTIDFKALAVFLEKSQAHSFSFQLDNKEFEWKDDKGSPFDVVNVARSTIENFAFRLDGGIDGELCPLQTNFDTSTPFSLRSIVVDHALGGEVGKGIRDNSVKLITAALQSPDSMLVRIGLREIQLGKDNKSLVLLSAALAVNATLTDLDLDQNDIDDAGFAILMPGLLASKNLSALNVKYNDLTENSADFIGLLIALNRFHTLDLRQQPLGDKGWPTIAKALQPHQTLTELNCWGEENKAASSMAMLAGLFQALKQPGMQLRRVGYGVDIFADDPNNLAERAQYNLLLAEVFAVNKTVVFIFDGEPTLFFSPDLQALQVINQHTQFSNEYHWKMAVLFVCYAEANKANSTTMRHSITPLLPTILNFVGDHKEEASIVESMQAALGRLAQTPVAEKEKTEEEKAVEMADSFLANMDEEKDEKAEPKSQEKSSCVNREQMRSRLDKLIKTPLRKPQEFLSALLTKTENTPAGKPPIFWRLAEPPKTAAQSAMTAATATAANSGFSSSSSSSSSSGFGSDSISQATHKRKASELVLK